MSCTCQDVYETVAALIGEDHSDSAAEPIKQRIPALISVCAVEMYELDRAYRMYVLGNPESASSADIFPGVSSLSDPLPVCDRLLAPMSFKVAALVVRDENPELSEMLMSDCVKSCAAVAESIPAKVGYTLDVYK